MPQNKDLKRLVRARMAETGERYTQALAHVLSLTRLDPLPLPWRLTGSHAPDYELGLLPGLRHDGNRIVQLRLRPGLPDPVGFGALMQSIAATRYAGRRVRFSAMTRAVEVSGWAGLWLRADGPRGTLTMDNMEDRPLRRSTGWAEADIVLDVPGEATELHFGALLAGAGAVELTQPRLGEADAGAPVTAVSSVVPLPEEPQALDFAARP